MASTFATNAAQWRVRSGGNELNGGGFNPFQTNVGTDYSDQDSPQLSLTDLATAGASASVSSVTGGFTSLMIGNVIRIASGTNFTADYYIIASVADTNNATLDRTCSTGVGANGVCRVGGAFASPKSFATAATGTLGTPTLASPLLPGNRIYIRGSGSLDPGSADYDFSGGTWTMPSGTRAAASAGDVHLIGYNDRPRIDHAGQPFKCDNWQSKHLSFFRKSASTLPVFTAAAGAEVIHTTQDCIYDQNGNDSQEWYGEYGGVLFCEVRNTGGGAAGTAVAIELNHPSNACVGNYIHGVRGIGVSTGPTGGIGPTTFCSIAYNTIIDCGSHGIRVNVSTAPYLYAIFNNTCDGNGGSGLDLQATALGCTAVFNNIFSNNAIGVSSSSTLILSRRLKRNVFDANCYFGNAANFSGGGTPTWALQTNDLTTDPQYVNRAGKNFATGINMRTKGISGLGGVGGTVGVAVNNVNIGAYQGPSAPGVPTIGTATAGNAQASVTYTAPANNGGSAITSYTATSTPGSITGILSQAGSGTITVSGLSNGISYTFTIHSTNVIGNSAESAASNSCTPTAPAVTTLAGVGADVFTWKDELEARQKKRDLEIALRRALREEKKIAETEVKIERKIEAEKRQNHNIDGLLSEYMRAAMKREAKKSEVKSLQSEYDASARYIDGVQERIEDDEDDDLLLLGA